MKVPPLLLGLALAVWGWQNQALVYAVPMAALLEAAAATRWRWDFSDRDFNRLSDLSALGLALLMVYQFDERGLAGIYAILQWLPAVLFLMVAAQVYSTRESIRYASLFLSVRRAEARGALDDAGSVDFRLPFLVVCLVAATAGSVRGPWLYPGLAGVALWMLAGNRPRGHGLARWALCVALALGVGYGLVRGVMAARRMIEPALLAWFQDRVWARRDPYRAHTALGQIGALKLSDRIVLRVKTERGSPPPLLREASYQVFVSNSWLARRFEFRAIPPQGDGTAWTLDRGAAGSQVRISREMPRGRGLLAVPGGTAGLADLPVEDLLVNDLGTLKVPAGPGLVEYRASFSPGGLAGGGVQSPPLPADLDVPERLRPVLEERAAEMGAAGLAPTAAAEALRQAFLREYRYTLDLPAVRRGLEPLADFLVRTRRGHCEYFATATVLMLRVLGVPSRYQVGYSVQEYSPLEDAWLVRRRHAHSWALAWIGGRWVDLDTTPPVWAALEAEAAPWWEPLYDLFSWAGFRYERWRWSPSEEGSRWYVWLVLPLAGVLAWRLRASRRVARRRDAGAGRRTRAPGRGADSEIYQVARVLAARGHPRREGETLSAWLARVHAVDPAGGAGEALRDLLPGHYRHRFDPRGLDRRERAALAAAARRWLDRSRPAPGT